MLSFGAFLLLNSGSSKASRKKGRPHVVVVSHDIQNFGGMSTILNESIKRITADYDVSVVSTSISDALQDDVTWIRVRVPRRPFILRFVLFFCIAAIKVRRLRPDLVHSVGAIIPNRVDAVSVFHCHAGVLDRVGRVGPPGAPMARRVNSAVGTALAFAAERWCYRATRCKVFLVLSTGVEGELRRRFGELNIVIAEAGVDSQLYSPNPVSRAGIRADQGVVDDLVLLFLGGDWDRKGLSHVIRAARVLERARVPVSLWVVGHGDFARFTKLSDHLGLAGRVHFFDAPVCCRRFYHGADVFVLPSHYEAFSLVMLEAAASGLPLVVSDVGVARDLIGAGKGGHIVSPHAADVARAVQDLAQRAAAREDMGRYARSQALGYSWSRIASITASTYRSLLALDGEAEEERRL